MWVHVIIEPLVRDRGSGGRQTVGGLNPVPFNKESTTLSTTLGILLKSAYGLYVFDLILSLSALLCLSLSPVYAITLKVLLGD